MEATERDASSFPAPDAPLTPEPHGRLAPEAKWLWRVVGAGWSLPLVALARVAAGGLEGTAATLVVLLAVAAIVAAVAIVPGLRWRRWRYEIREEEIDIRHGALAIRRTLVPISRVQHVETRVGPLQRVFNLSTVVFHTAAGEIAVPQLRDAEARSVRDRVAALTRVPDDV